MNTKELYRKTKYVINDIIDGNISIESGIDNIVNFILQECSQPQDIINNNKNLNKIIEQEKNNIKKQVQHELDELLIKVFRYLDNTKTKLRRTEEGEHIQFTIGFNEGVYTTTQKLKNLLSELWQEISINKLDKNNETRNTEERITATELSWVSTPFGWQSGIEPQIRQEEPDPNNI